MTVTAVLSSMSAEPPERKPRQLSNMQFLMSAAAISVVLGLAFAKAPLAIPAAAMGLSYFWLCFNRPAFAISAFLFSLVAIPVYLRLPLAGPLPSPPIAISMLVSLAAAALLARMTGDKTLPFSKGGRLLIATFLLWGLIMLLSLSDERTGSESINMWFKAVAFPIAVIVVLSKGLRGAGDINTAYKALLAAALAISIYGAWEYSIGQNWLMDTFMPEGLKEWSADDFSALASAGESYRSFSVFTQPIEFATCVGMIYPYALVQMGFAKSLWRRLAYSILALICLAGIASSFSRMPLAAALLGAVLVSIIIKPLRIWLAAAVASGALALLLAWPWVGAMIASRLSDVDNLTIRVKLWEAASAIFRDHPFLGVGIGNFPLYHIEAIRAHHIGPFDEFGGSGLDRISVAESTYYQMAAEGGVLGLASFAVMMIAFFLLVIRGYRSARTTLQKSLYIAVGLGAVNYLTNSLTITAYTHFTSTMLLLGVLFAFILILDRQLQQVDMARLPEAGSETK